MCSVLYQAKVKLLIGVSAPQTFYEGRLGLERNKEGTGLKNRVQESLNTAT